MVNRSVSEQALYAAVEKRAAEMVDEKLAAADAQRAVQDSTPAAFVTKEEMAAHSSADYYLQKQASENVQLYESWTAEYAATVLLAAAGYYGSRRRK